MTTAALFAPQTPSGLFTSPPPSVSDPLGSTGGSGAISGGLLRPGSIDQTTFVQMLQQQQQNRQAAGVGGKAVSMPIQGIQGLQRATPTLSSAQFAALVGAQNADQGLAPAPIEGPATDPQAIAAAQARVAVPAMPALRLSGAATRNALPNTPSQAAEKPAADAAGEDLPTITRAAKTQQASATTATTATDAEVPTITRKSAPAAVAAADESDAEGPAQSESEPASTSDPNVVHLKHPPDKDQMIALRMQNKRWVVDETPGARQLFFGPDGKFGWDDFLDFINPLQHIPGIAQIYRAVTGDEIHGAATLLGAIPFGPLGGIGMIGVVAELAVKDVTGKDIGGNLQAMVFGEDESPKDGAAPVPADMADAGESTTVTVQTAARETYAHSAASQRHEDCRS
jgi:hypothetical protein